MEIMKRNIDITVSSKKQEHMGLQEKHKAPEDEEKTSIGEEYRYRNLKKTTLCEE